MIRVIALASLTVVLAAVVTWEIMTPESTLEPAPPRAVASETRKAPATAFNADDLSRVAATIDARPLFNPGRKPGDGPAVPVAAAADSRNTDLPRLTGTIVGPDGGRAIFAGAGGKPRTAAVGETVGGYVVQAIVPGAVTLSGTDGERVVHPSYEIDQPAADAARPRGSSR